MCGTGGIGKSLYLPFSFVVNLKLLYKSKVLKKKRSMYPTAYGTVSCCYLTNT